MLVEPLDRVDGVIGGRVALAEGSSRDVDPVGEAGDGVDARRNDGRSVLSGAAPIRVGLVEAVLEVRDP